MSLVHPEMKVELIGDSDVLIRRDFHAAPALVYRAHTEPSLLQRWLLGPDGWDMPICEIDLRVGGKYRYGWKHRENGNAFGFFGTYQEIVPDRRIVQTECPDWQPDLPPAINTLTLEAQGDSTSCTLVLHYATPEIRQQALETGMTDGMAKTYDRLDAILSEIMD